MDDIKFEEITFGPVDTEPKQEQATLGDLTPTTPTAPVATTGDSAFWEMDDVETFEEFEELKPGTYPGTIVETNIKDYANGGRGFELVFKLKNGGQQEWTYFTFEHANQKVVGMGKRDLKAILTAFGLPTQFAGMNEVLAAFNQLKGLEGTMTIKHTPKSEGSEEYWVNKKFAKLA